MAWMDFLLLCLKKQLDHPSLSYNLCICYPKGSSPNGERMYKSLSVFFVVFSSLVFGNFEAPNPMAPAAPNFAMNNHPLIKVNGKTISLMDVVKKMNMIIHQYVPETRNSPIKLFQFYMSQWKPTLDDMIFNELTIADAEEKDIKISDGDVREEMEKRFGPNMISTLNRLNLQYDEARQMVHDDLMVRQLQGAKIYSKAQMSITPEVIKKEYFAHLEKNPPLEEWEYQVISARGKENADCKSFMEKLSSDLTLGSKKLEDLLDSSKQDSETSDQTVSLNLSKDYVVNDKNLSKEHRDILTQLQEKSFSSPVAQYSRASNSTVYRIFYLKSHTTTQSASFQSMYEEIESRLVSEAIQKEREAYREKLLKKFGVSKDYLKAVIPDDYKPFSVR